MPANPDNTGTVSWRVFNDLYESQYDFFRKLRFFIKAGRFEKNEKITLDMIEEFLTGKEEELEAIRERGFEEWKCSGQASGELSIPSEGPLAELTQMITDRPSPAPEEAQAGTMTFRNWLKKG